MPTTVSSARTRAAQCLALAAALLVPAPRAEAARGPTARDQFFAATNAHTFVIRIATDELAKLRRNNRAYVLCVVTVDGNFFVKDAGIHLKGGAGSFRGIDDKPALTLSFGKFQDGQKLMGVRKLHLNNSVQDPSFMTENIAGWMFDRAGVPAPLVTYARVELNGRDLGFYVAIEGFAKDFLHRYFDDVTGNLYDGGFGQDLDAKKQKLSGEDPNEQRDLRALVDAARETDPQRRWERLSQVLDVDRFASFLALEVLTSHWDGYTHNRNNYRLYSDPKTGRFVFFPHGMDQMFGGGQHALRPGALNGLLAAAFMQVPQGRALYEDKVRAAYTNVFDLEAVINRVNHLAAIIRPALAAVTPRAAQDHAGQVSGLRDRIVARHRAIGQQLGSPPPEAMKFAADNSAKLPRWETRQDSGEPVHDQPKLDGRATLHIHSKGAPTVASWRTTVLLAAGRYRFTGDAKAAGIEPHTGAPGTGAGLRISGGQRENKLFGSSAWTALAHEFEVGDLTEVTLVAELRANKGEVWFDAGSLKLTRLRN
jgi:spore coat protein CotH